MKRNASTILMIVFTFLIILIISIVGILLQILLPAINSTPTNFAGDTVSIASWNLQNFGPTKAENETLLQSYAYTLKDYDIVVLQEIRDPSTDAIRMLAAKLPDYKYRLSTPAGQGTSKEQYAIFFKDGIRLVNITDFTETDQDIFERPPLKVTFQVKNWTFTLYTIHIKVDNVPQELSSLEDLIDTPASDTILLGDLNADGDNYYDGVIQHFLDWHWMITSDMDTTVAKSSNAYDRIIVNDATMNNFINVGIMNDVKVSQSDHYLIYALFTPQKQ